MTKAKHDHLLMALIAKLPMEIAQWPRLDRIAWLQMMAMAFNVVYGPCDGIRVVPEETRCDEADRTASAPDHLLAAWPAATEVASNRPQRFYVDRDGFALGDGKPIAMEDLPAGAILWDERVGIESGDVAAILWRNTGTSRRSLPPGVILRPIFDES